MDPIENTTQQLHYPTGDQPTRAHMAVPTVQTAAVPSVPPAPAPPAPRPPAHTSGRGKTTISDEVIERVIQKLVDLAVEKVDGVHGLRGGVDRFFGEAESPEQERAVAVRLADGEATINISIEVDFGYAVHSVVNEVRAFVISEAEQLLGLTVAEVNVAVSEVSFDPPAAGDAPA